MPQAIPLAIQAAGAAGWLTAGATFFLSASATLIISQEQANAAKRKARDAYNASLTDRLIQVRSGVMPRQYVLGTCRVAGGVLYGDSVGTNKTAVDMVTALAANKCALIGHYMDDEYIAVDDFPGVKYGNPFIEDFEEYFTVTGPTDSVDLTVAPISDAKVKVYYHPVGGKQAAPAWTRSGATLNFTGLSGTRDIRVVYKANNGLKVRSFFFEGTDSQAAHSWGDVTTPLWTSDHRIRGICGFRTLYLWDPNIWAERGASQHGAVLEGHDLDTHAFYDPRDDSNPDYTTNPMLLAAWFSLLPREMGGMGYPESWIDWGNIADEANICDETIEVRQLDGTGYEEIKRYEFHGVLSTANAPADNLAIILGACAGRKVFTAGYYRFKAGAFTAATLTITDADIVGTEPIHTSTGGDPVAIPNVVTATFADATKNWQESSPPAVINEDYIDADGYEEPLDLRFPGSTDPRQVNYLMGIALESSRPSFALRLTVGGIGENLALLDTVDLSIVNRSCYDGRTFEVVDRVDHWNGRFTIELAEIKETTWALDPDTFTPEVPAEQPDTSYLWSVAVPEDFEAELLTPQLLPDGTSLARVQLTWEETTSEYVRQAGQYNVRYRRMGEGGPWISAGSVPGDAVSTTITAALEDGDDYQFQVQAQNGLGARSEWADDFVNIVGTVVAAASGWAADSEGKPAGWRGVEGITDRSQLAFAGTAMRITDSPIDTVAYGLPAIPIDDSVSYTLTIRHRSTAAPANGLYVRFNEIDTDMPMGFTHIGTVGEPVVTARVTYVDVITYGPMPGTTAIEETFTYTPTAGTKFASLTAYNWLATGSVSYDIEWARLCKVGSNVNLLAGLAGVDGRILVARGNCVVSNTSIQKSGGTGAWDSDTFSASGFASAHVRFKVNQVNAEMMIGLNSDPLADQNYTSIDRAFYFNSAGTIYIYESGGSVASYGSYTEATVLDLIFDGTDLRYYKDGVLLRTVATSGPLFFDSSFYTPGGGVNSVVFGPGTVPGQVDTSQIGDGAVTDFVTHTDAGPDRIYMPGGVLTGTPPSFSYTPDFDGVAHVVCNFSYSTAEVGGAGPPAVYLRYVGSANWSDANLVLGDGTASLSARFDLTAGVAATIGLHHKVIYGGGGTVTNEVTFRDTSFICHFVKK